MNLARRFYDVLEVFTGATHVDVAGRTPRCSVDGSNSVGVFRLHKVIGFADDLVPLKMTKVWRVK
jgi:hypothetical protein